MKKKNSGIELQFHWIFIMIAGAFILAFFISIASRQRATQQDKLEMQAATEIDTLFTGASGSKGAFQQIPAPKTSISFECTTSCSCSFSVGKKQTQYGERNIFSVSKGETTDLSLWTIPWDFGIRGGNFLIISNSKTRLILVYDPSDQTSKDLLADATKTLPPELVTGIITPDKIRQLQPVEESTVRVVFLGVPARNLLRDLSFSSPKDTTAVFVGADNTLLFYSYDGTRWVASTNTYVTTMERYAAMFSTSAMYSCTMQKAYERLKFITIVYINRLPHIASSKCSYSQSRALLEEFLELVKKIGKGNSEVRPSELTVVLKKIETENAQLQVASCPLLY